MRIQLTPAFLSFAFFFVLSFLLPEPAHAQIQDSSLLNIKKLTCEAMCTDEISSHYHQNTHWWMVSNPFFYIWILGDVVVNGDDWGEAINQCTRLCVKQRELGRDRDEKNFDDVKALINGLEPWSHYRSCMNIASDFVKFCAYHRLSCIQFTACYNHTHSILAVRMGDLWYFVEAQGGRRSATGVQDPTVASPERSKAFCELSRKEPGPDGICEAERGCVAMEQPSAGTLSDVLECAEGHGVAGQSCDDCCDWKWGHLKKNGGKLESNWNFHCKAQCFAAQTTRTNTDVGTCISRWFLRTTREESDPVQFCKIVHSFVDTKEDEALCIQGIRDHCQQAPDDARCQWMQSFKECGPIPTDPDEKYGNGDWTGGHGGGGDFCETPVVGPPSQTPRPEPTTATSTGAD